ncbi:unnamed protein product [Miscanthus lutarioriparius]|uniref:Uncharacterized protein n=1 Tax=Miscanthus lutarioriparius TaxID=422564 RepID=A0A811MIG9_9POAL|nr:unnamed protein product [Miscanthus lutarioriparius]
MEPEAAMLSQLQLQLLALVSEFRLLRERERGAREELRDAGQRWEAAAEEHRREARELRAEVAARDDSIRRLEARIKCLENENELLEKNENNLKESMEVLLQSREAFIKHYEDSTCSMQWTIQMKDKQIAVISEKLNSHLVLFSSVEKEVAAMQQVLGDVHCLVGEKENVVADLKDKVQRISVLEKDFAMRLELHNMEIALQKFQDLFSSIGNEGMKSFSAISESPGIQDVNNEQLERIPGSQCGLANEHTSVSAVVKEATTQNVDHQLEIDPGSMQVQSPVHFKSGALPSPELVSANTETGDSLLEPKGDIDMGGLSPARPTDCLNLDPDTENQS